MSKTSQKMKSWQVFHFCRKHFGNSALYAIFGTKCSRTVDRWCQNPQTTGKNEGAFDPLSGMKELVDLLDDQGHTGVIRSIIGYLLDGTTIDVGVNQDIIDPKDSMMEEELLDHRAIAVFHAAIDSDAPLETILKTKEEAIAEIERTYARYLLNQG